MLSSIKDERSEWINLNKAKAWIDFCDSHHGSHCQSRLPMSDSPFSLPTLLIDVDANCLHPIDNSHLPYVAMSYVWGHSAGEEVLQTMMSNHSTFLQHDVFSKPEIQSRIPDDIHVAMHVTRALGLKYLWCDRFCIVQDDYNVKAKQIANMASIYAHSVVTIVCAAHTPQGLDFKPGAKPRSSFNLAFWGGSHNHQGLINSSTWNTRGWTLQELVFSQRAIFVHEDSITWQCHCMTQEEDSKPTYASCNWRYSELARGLHFSTWLDLREYAHLVGDYSRRKLTYEDDVLNAFSGITNTLTKTFLGGFYFGLPRLFFDTAMLWQSKNQLLRRNEEVFPSWSWMGWVGKIDVDNWKLGSNYVLDATHKSFSGTDDTDNANGTYFRVFSTIPWVPVSAESEQTLDGSTAVPPRQQVSLQGLIDRAENSAQESLVGSDTQQSQWNKNGDYWFHPCDNLKRFRYPIPVAIDTPSRIQNIPTSLLQLGALTTTARLWCVPECASADVGTGAFAYWDNFNMDNFDMDRFNMDRFNMDSFKMDSFDMDSFDMNSFNMNSFDMNSFNINAEWNAGHTNAKFNLYQSHKNESSFRIGTLQSDGHNIGSTAAEKGKRYCDFVAISELCALDDDKEYLGNKRGFLRYVNVLWVEKVDGVCYRRGLGRVYKNAWLECAKEEKVVLG